MYKPPFLAVQRALYKAIKNNTEITIPYFDAGAPFYELRQAFKNSDNLAFGIFENASMFVAEDCEDVLLWEMHLTVEITSNYLGRQQTCEELTKLTNYLQSKTAIEYINGDLIWQGYKFCNQKISRLTVQQPLIYDDGQQWHTSTVDLVFIIEQLDD